MILLLGVAVVAGTTFAGADWASGSMANQVLFEPRRVKVWAAKAAAVVLGTAAFGAALLAAFWGALLAAAAMRDIATPPEVLTEILQTSGRGVALAAGGALGAFALTMLFRSTVGALGLLFGYVVAGEALVATLPVAKMSQWALSSNIQSWLSSGIELYDDSLCEGEVFDGGCDATYLLTFAQSATYLSVVVAIAVMASILAFRQRDIP
jgi:hypothetical protein